MRVRKLTGTGDYSFGQSGKDFFVNEPAAVGQITRTGLLLFQGEWYLDTTQGVPYFTSIIGKHPQAMADSTVQQQIAGTLGVTNIQSYSSSVDDVTRTYSVGVPSAVVINTAFGPTQVQIQNYQNF